MVGVPKSSDWYEKLAYVKSKAKLDLARKHNIMSMIVDIDGTTYSGHPTGTTLGNTLRNWIYHLFAMFKCLPEANDSLVMPPEEIK